MRRNQFQFRDLIRCIKGSSDVELAMNGRTDSSLELIDHKTCRSICDAVGERLQQNLHRAKSELPADLAQLIEELRQRDGGDLKMPN